MVLVDTSVWIDVFRKPVTVRSGIDCLIAACALRHNLAVVHVERDFTNLARVSQLDATDLNRPAKRG